MEHEKLITFQEHLNELRNTTSCKICLKPFYEPFVLGCGHTYCYSCLRSWFNGNLHQKHRNCPDCRKAVRTIPSPNYVLRDLAHKFITHAELLPEDESLEEHRIGMAEEAKLLADDKTSKGLFLGVFAKYDIDGVGNFFGNIARRIHDPIDNVTRCPVCHWELEDGQCNACGWYDEDYDEDADFDDHDSMTTDTSTHSSAIGDLLPSHHGSTRFLGHHSDADSEEHSETANAATHPLSVEEDFDEMDGFITDDDDLPDETDGDTIEWSERPRRHYHPEPNEDEDEDDDDENDRDGDGDSSDDLYSSSLTASPASHSHRQRGRQPEGTPGNRARVAAHTINHEESDVSTNYDESEDQDSEALQGVTTTQRKRGARVVISDEDDEDEEEEDDEDDDEPQNGLRNSVTGAASADDVQITTRRSRQYNDVETDSDDTSVPPQGAAARRNRLYCRRARRSVSRSTPTGRQQEARVTARQTARRGRIATTVH